MKRITFLIAAVVFSLSFVSAPDIERNKNFIYWGDREITWEDFKGKAPRTSPYSAITASAIEFGISGDGSGLNFSVYTIFDTKQSWKKKGASDHLLNHEKVHFDITEIYARMLRREIQETKFKKYETLTEDIQKMYQKNYNDCSALQDTYDDETEHSKNRDQQLFWNAKVAGMLDSLKDWSTPEFVVDVSYLVK